MSFVSFLFFTTDELLSFLLGALYQSYKLDCCLTNTDAHVTGGSEDGFIYFWDLVDASVVSSFRAHSSVVMFSALPPPPPFFFPLSQEMPSLNMMALNGHGISCTYNANIFKRVFPSSDINL
jgi:WD40 repeat protein